MSLAGVIQIIVNLTLTVAGHCFTAYCAIPFAVADTASGLATRYQLERSNILMSEDRQHYAEPPEGYLNHCRPGVLAICPATHTTSPASAPCTWMSGKATQRLCCRKAILGTPEDAWDWDHYHHHWLYSVTSEQHPTSHCSRGDQSETSELIIHGLGEVATSEGCSLRTDSYELLPTTRHAGENHLEKG
ncbi:uncharacterized protein LOC120351334 [Nilaparvata lugens]|uniref:uncharacterized protein LOC120351334 n=1 Tax=Nilaparvata lugens TaxID=108931 RepID=UPI00193CD585|nr:uncharacterized protein LOC120351334 [Nilaparvata lugens]